MGSQLPTSGWACISPAGPAMLTPPTLLPIIVTLLINVIGKGEGAVAMGMAEMSEGNSSLCVEPGVGEVRLVGEVWTPSQFSCASAVCTWQGTPERLLVTYTTCGLVAAPTLPCRLTSSPELDFPLCCPTYSCPTDSEDASQDDHEDSQDASQEDFHDASQDASRDDHRRPGDNLEARP